MKDLEEFLEPWLDLPIGGKKYRVKAADAVTGLYAQHILELGVSMQVGAKLTETQVAQLQLDDDGEQDFHRRLLGDTLDEMIADKVSWEAIKHVSRTVFVWVVQDRDAAEAYWERGGRPEAPRPTPGDRRPKKKTKKSARPGSPAGSTTPKPAAAASPGPSSSGTGT